jgi:hypothetical protein
MSWTTDSPTRDPGVCFVDQLLTGDPDRGEAALDIFGSAGRGGYALAL